MTRVEELIEQVRALPWEEQEEFRLLLEYGDDVNLARISAPRRPNGYDSRGEGRGKPQEAAEWRHVGLN